MASAQRSGGTRKALSKKRSKRTVTKKTTKRRKLQLDEPGHGVALIIRLCEQRNLQMFRDLADQDDLFIDEEVDWFRFVVDHYNQYQHLPSATALSDGMHAQCIVEDELTYYYDKVLERRARNELRPVLRQLEQVVRDQNHVGIADLLRRGTAIYDSRRNNRVVRHSTLSTGLAGVIENLTDERIEALENERKGIATGWQEFDDLFSGYTEGQLVIWAARPNIGKTYLLLNAALTAAREGTRGAFISIEQSSKAIFERLVSMVSGINPQLLRSRRVSTHAQARIERCVLELEDMDHLEIHASDMNMTTTYVRELINTSAPEVVYIDGLYLMRSVTRGGRSKNRYDQVADVMDDLRAMTLETGVPIIATTQFNRGAGAGGGEGSLETIGYSDTIATHSDIVFGVKNLWDFAVSRKLEMDRSLRARARGYRMVEVAKSRDTEQDLHFCFNFGFSPVNFSIENNVVVEMFTDQDRKRTDPHGRIVDLRSDPVGWMRDSPSGEEPGEGPEQE